MPKQGKPEFFKGQRKNSKLYVHPEGPYKLPNNQETFYGKFLMERNAAHKTQSGETHVYTHCYTFRKKCPARAVFTKDDILVKNGLEPHNHPPVDDEVDQFRLLMELRKAQQICNGNTETIFKCELCVKVFSHKKSLLAHYRGAHRVEPSNSDGALQNYHCVHCKNAVFATLTRLRCHYVDTHQFDPVTQKLEFDTLTAFEQWKRALETETGVRFRRRWGSRKRKDGSLRFRYSCQNNDPFMKGSAKKGVAWCPAEIMVVKDATSGNVVVEFHTSHYGHKNVQPSNDIEDVESLMEEEEDEPKEGSEQQQIFLEQANADVSGAEEAETEWESSESNEVQMVSEEGVGAEDTAVLIQETENVGYQLVNPADPACDAQRLEDTVASMKEVVGLTQVAVKQGSTLKGPQQVRGIAKMTELLQLVLNVTLLENEYSQFHNLLDAALIIHKRRLQRQQQPQQGEAEPGAFKEGVINADSAEPGQVIASEDQDNSQHLYADHCYSTQEENGEDAASAGWTDQNQ